MKILVVAPYFAPYSLVGAQRINSFVNYASSNGHEVTVVSYSLQYLETFGKDALKAKIPNSVRIVRVDVGHIPKSVTKRNRMFQTAFKENIESILNCEVFDVCIVTVGPFFTLDVVRSVMAGRNVPFYVDYRDLISMGHPGGFIERVKSLRSAMNMDITNKRCIDAASGVITVSETCKEILVRKNKTSVEHVFVVYNGYDESQLENISDVEWTPKTKYAVGYFGKFMYYEERLGVLILKAISKLKQEGFDIALYHMGPPVTGIDEVLGRNGIASENYVHMGSKPYAAGIGYLRKMDCCAIEWNSLFGLGTKVFDYIYVNKPIVGCMEKKTELGQFLSGFKNTVVSTSEREIYEFIKYIITSRVANLGRDTDPQMYSRRKQNERMEQIIMRGGVKNE